MSNCKEFLLVCLLLLHVQFTLAAPSVVPVLLAKRQNGAPVTVTTVNTVQGSSGPVTETCSITLTPITVGGQPAFREEKSCTQAPASAPPASAPSANSSEDPTSQTSLSATSTTITTIAASATQISATDSTATSSLAAPTDVSVIGASVSATSAIPTGSSTSSGIGTSLSATSFTSSFAAPTDISVLGPSSLDTASANAALATSTQTTGSPNTSSTTAAFAIPGKQIQVLPIGLGVFAGVSVIALIVVGLVTYERTKYRKKFRKERLVESAAPMGYGGMAETRP